MRTHIINVKIHTIILLVDRYFPVPKILIQECQWHLELEIYPIIGLNAYRASMLALYRQSIGVLKDVLRTTSPLPYFGTSPGDLYGRYDFGLGFYIAAVRTWACEYSSTE